MEVGSDMEGRDLVWRTEYDTALSFMLHHVARASARGNPFVGAPRN